jgi:hypothetical protein
MNENLNHCMLNSPNNSKEKKISTWNSGFTRNQTISEKHFIAVEKVTLCSSGKTCFSDIHFFCSMKQSYHLISMVNIT